MQTIYVVRVQYHDPRYFGSPLVADAVAAYADRARALDDIHARKRELSMDSGKVFYINQVLLDDAVADPHAPPHCGNERCKYFGRCKYMRNETHCAMDIEVELGINISRCGNCSARVWRARHNMANRPFCATCSNEEQGRIPFTLTPNSCANDPVQIGWHT